MLSSNLSIGGNKKGSKIRIVVIWKLLMNLLPTIFLPLMLAFRGLFRQPVWVGPMVASL